MKRRTHFNVFSALLVILLFAIIACIFFLHSVGPSLPTVTETSVSVSSQQDTGKETDGPFAEEAEDFAPIFVGDSRTVGMRDALIKASVEDSSIYIAEAGEGWGWFTSAGIFTLRDYLNREPNRPVIFNLGVNDYVDIDSYIHTYQELTEEYPDTRFYFLSVNPVVDEQCAAVKNEDVAAFNQRLKETFPDQYLDCYTYLMANGYKTVDGLHYTAETYQTIYDYVMDKIE